MQLQAEFPFTCPSLYSETLETSLLSIPAPSLAGLPKSTCVEDNWTSPGPALHWGRQEGLGELCWQHSAIWGIYADFIADGVLFRFASYKFMVIVLFCFSKTQKLVDSERPQIKRKN